MTPYDRIDKQLGKEVTALEEQLSDGSLSVQEYNQAVQAMERAARAELREASEDAYRKTFRDY